MLEGLVVKGTGGFFDVAQGTQLWRCRARGVFRKRGVTVLVGDHVRFHETGPGEGLITEVLPRQTELVRPPIANADQALLVFSIKSPDFHPGLLDRTLIAVSAAGLRPILVVSKVDLADHETVRQAVAPYEGAGYPVYPVAPLYRQGIDALVKELTGHITVFAGPSGVGKSSLANAIDPELGLKMGQISDKLKRGRHTTRHVELFRIAEGTFIADAPGFSQLQIDVPATELRYFFPEFPAFAEDCAYRGCLHIEEEQCGVKRAVQTGALVTSRYEDYRQIYFELRQKEARRY
ncbi:MAG: ribosome small subunit-dependent GTPase A [Alicyclobacillus herbarius]|uniref:ribosome small subunit-dependent GTPase A n=1 Tax=Alicyclobacillus herbarius TaxID=122960 RepID=UPI00235561A1|nr:ribosome small subunit-dependent GTPase A [Alicyclobacillus herbarius]MCL6632118.1 ribosome small subunit-dependent GTPase A [Alicyclobacillus herbarius]